jgi:acyl carrier protein
MNPVSGLFGVPNVKEDWIVIEALVRSYIRDNFLFTDNGNLEDDTSFLQEGIVDSTGVLELVMFVEETFDIAVEDEEVVPENFDSVAQLARYVRSKTELVLV